MFCSRVEYCTPVGRELEKLLLIPIQSYNDMITVLGLAHFAPLLSIYDFEGRRAMAVYIANNVVENSTLITTAEQSETVLGLLSPLIQNETDIHPRHSLFGVHKPLYSNSKNLNFTSIKYFVGPFRRKKIL